MIGLVAFVGFSCTKENKEDLRASQNNGPIQDSCVTSDLTYQNSIESILNTNCATSGCHLGPNAPGGVDLSTFDDSKKIAGNGDLVGRIEGTSGALMPPGSPLPACEIDKLKAWVADGAPNN